MEERVNYSASPNGAREEIVTLLMSTNREGIENLIKYMDESDFFTAPCSTQYHNAFDGGLAEHSLNVCRQMSILSVDGAGVKTVGGFDHSSVITTSLLHDLGKATYRGKENYVPNYLKSGALSAAKPYTTNSERLYVPHEVVSVIIAGQFIELTEEEEFAILYHNGLYVPSGRDISGKERPLQLLLHFADMWCSRFIEARED